MKIINGNLLDVEKGIIVHQTNTLGVAGGGIALQIRKKWPKWYDDYHDFCQTNPLLGSIFIHRITPNFYICDLFGQKTLGGFATDYDSYDAALPKIKEYGRELNLQIYFNYGIGCGLAGGDWKIISEKLEKYVSAAILIKFD